MFAFLIEFFTQIISSAGYPGLTFLMMLESMIAPVPSEAVMPFAGFLIYQSKMSWEAVVLFSTLGSIIGSLISYYIGMNFGRPLIIKYGRYLLLNEHHLDLTENFFKKFGQKTIFISRFIPLVRHFISLPAGTARMNIWIFSLYTILGATMWNFFLTYLGYRLGSNWEVIRTYSEKLDVVVVALIIFVISYVFYKNKKHRKQREDI
ncbi:MAG: DedA family protein [Candidatus Pacebacteria bacterium]|nr:DedA family protein [Candidatus Paceibacterota bacterium]